MDLKCLKLSDRAKKTLIIVSFTLIGIILIIMSGFSPKEQSTESGKSRLDIYIEETENRLTDTVSSISGAGVTKVFITAENTFETVYASNASISEGESSKTTEKSLAYTGSSSYGSEPVVVKELCPQIKGVLIVCEGGNKQSVKDDITSSVSIALGIPKTKIHVTGGTHK